MKKIPTLFVRNSDDRRYVTRDVHPDCQWVIDGEGVATLKYDGTCMKFDGEQWWARREVKPGKRAPAHFVPEQVDEITGKTVGWEPIGQSAFARFHAEAVARHENDDRDAGVRNSDWPMGTYELVGPKINGNPEGIDGHELWAHAAAPVLDAPRDFNWLAKWLADFDGEGIVWHHPDGRMAKLKRKDFPG